VSKIKQYFIAFGGNLGPVEENFLKAAKMIEDKVGEICLKSSIYISKALTLGGLDTVEMQNDYLNCVVSLNSNKEEYEVLKVLNQIENELGRTRKKRWDSRSIDLDIVALGQRVLKTTDLTIPHKEMHKRTFVLMPLNEIAPRWLHPILNKNALELLDVLESSSGVETPCRILKSFPDYES